MTTYNRITIQGLEVFYREAGSPDRPTIVLLHGFPSSSHMFRDLIPKLAADFHVIAPDLIGFGYSAQPPASQFSYTFDNLASIVEQFLFDALKLKNFSIYVQDYGSPVGFRIANKHPHAIDTIIVQNGNAYLEGLSPAWEPLRKLWSARNPNTEAPVREFLTSALTKFQYTHGAKNPARISPDSYTFDQFFLDRPGNDAVQLNLFYDYASNLALYPQWQSYFRRHQPPTLIVWGQNDPFFTVEGARAFQRDLPKAELHLLDTGHFALEEESESIAAHITRFLTAPSNARSSASH
jgi:pimeloyl-ACP methyl ester carboxylesterase